MCERIDVGDRPTRNRALFILERLQIKGEEGTRRIASVVFSTGNVLYIDSDGAGHLELTPDYLDAVTDEELAQRIRAVGRILEEFFSGIRPYLEAVADDKELPSDVEHPLRSYVRATAKLSEREKESLEDLRLNYPKLMVSA
ncbi:MAG: hypothetical protein WC519_00375 [Parcubacteria group bacterium]